jgi:hypothetical protein
MEDEANEADARGNEEIEQEGEDANRAATTEGERHIAIGRRTDGGDGQQRETQGGGGVGSGGRTRRTTEVDESFYTARATDRTEPATQRRSRAMSEEPSVASPNKSIKQQQKDRGRRVRTTGGMRRLVMRVDGAEEGSPSDITRQRAA